MQTACLGAAEKALTGPIFPIGVEPRGGVTVQPYAWLQLPPPSTQNLAQ